MASTSASSGRTEIEPETVSQGMAPSSSSFSPSSSRSLFSCCFDWVSDFLSRRSMESNAMESTSGTSGCIQETEPFQGMAPSASAMGISSTLIQKQSYDVFINHRGPDVKKTLASKIYDILGNMKVTAFLDSEELEYGDFLPATLAATIRGATLHIAIFSERYAESAWCLEELSLMLQSGAKIIPIFYRVEPTDLKCIAQGKGMYVAAFKKHEKNGRYKPAKLKEWKDALHKVSFYIGQIVKSNDDEMRMYKNIVNIVLKEISNEPLVVAEHPVGLDEIVKDFENTVQLADGDQSVQVVGIWGMGGLGKTTLAKKLYNKRSLSMERSSFIFDIREAKEKLQTKQTQLLKGLGVNEAIDNVEQGKAILNRHLKPFKVLIVMDDVDHVDQLDALLPAKDNLGNGSLIIVTTRERQVLDSWGISSVYKMRGLDQFNAEQLFCWHAFLQPYPRHGFEELVKCFIKVCDGLPLSMKVFGALLYGKSSKQLWMSLFNKISRILPEEIKKKLKISYDDLDYEEKEAFLDVACFFIGEENSLAVEVWDGSEGSGLLTWERLLNKSLVEVDNVNFIRMHDHLRDLGREIASQHSPSRIWLSKQIINFGKQKEKINDIRGIKIDDPTGIKELLLYREAFTPDLARLKLLVIDRDYSFDRISGEEFTNLVQVIGEVSTELVWIRWVDFRERNLARLSLKNLRVLQLSDSDCLEELWEAESDAPVQLKELSIVSCHKFHRFPNSLGDLSSLTHLKIDACLSLESLPTSLGDLSSLTRLEIRSRPELECLFSVGRLSLLEHVAIFWCPLIQVDFEAPPLSSALSNLKRMELVGTKVCRISVSDHYPRLESLELLYNRDLTEIKALPVKLECLDIRGSPKLVELPSFAQLTSLRQFILQDGNRIEKIEGLKHCTRLEILTLHTCWEVPGIESLEHMERLKSLELRANKGSAIVSCIQTIQKWPDLHEILICTRVVPDVSSLLDSFKLRLSTNLSVSENIFSGRFSDGNAVMLCFVIKRYSSSGREFKEFCEEIFDETKFEEFIVETMRPIYNVIPWGEIGEERWAFIGFFTQRSRRLHEYARGWSRSVRVLNAERSLGVSGQEQSVGEALLSLVNIL